jgi:hypothetical protein
VLALFCVSITGTLYASEIVLKPENIPFKDYSPYDFQNNADLPIRIYKIESRQDYKFAPDGVKWGAKWYEIILGKTKYAAIFYKTKDGPDVFLIDRNHDKDFSNEKSECVYLFERKYFTAESLTGLFSFGGSDCTCALNLSFDILKDYPEIILHTVFKGVYKEQLEIKINLAPGTSPEFFMGQNEFERVYLGNSCISLKQNPVLKNESVMAITSEEIVDNAIRLFVGDDVDYITTGVMKERERNTGFCIVKESVISKLLILPDNGFVCIPKNACENSFCYKARIKNGKKYEIFFEIKKTDINDKLVIAPIEPFKIILKVEIKDSNVTFSADLYSAQGVEIIPHTEELVFPAPEVKIYSADKQVHSFTFPVD